MVSWPEAREIATFRDALGLSLELSHHHPAGHFAVITGPGHRIMQLTARLPGHPPDDVTVDRTGHHAGALWQELAVHGGGLLVISVEEIGPQLLSRQDQRAYRRCRAALARRGLTLLDWIRTDGDLIVSAAYRLHPATAWPDDPPAERWAEMGFDLPGPGDQGSGS